MPKYIFSALLLCAVPAWPLVYFFSIFLFDAPSSASNTLLNIFAWMLWLYPIPFILNAVLLLKFDSYVSLVISILWIVGAAIIFYVALSPSYVSTVYDRHEKQKQIKQQDQQDNQRSQQLSQQAAIEKFQQGENLLKIGFGKQFRIRLNQSMRIDESGILLQLTSFFGEEGDKGFTLMSTSGDKYVPAVFYENPSMNAKIKNDLPFSVEVKNSDWSSYVDLVLSKK